MSDDDYTCRTCHATISLIDGCEIPEPELWYCESCALDEIERLRAQRDAQETERTIREAWVTRLESALARIASVEGCECDSYEGHKCVLCRVREMARETSLDTVGDPSTLDDSTKYNG